MNAAPHNAPVAKLALLAAVILRPGLWDAQAEAWSKLIPHDHPADYLKHWGKLIQDKDAEVFDILAVQPGSDVASGVRVGVVIVTVCHDFLTPELIVLGAFSSDKYADLTEVSLAQVEDIAESKGCRSVRFHTMRPGLIAKALRSGFTVSEVIMRKEVNRHGR